MKNISELPVLKSVQADYTVGHSDAYVYPNACMPRRVSYFDNEWAKPDVLDDLLSTKEVAGLQKEIKKLKAKLAKQGENTVKRRLVKVVIVDPNENLNLEDAVLVNEPEKITDLEDNEIFFDMDIKAVLDAHNSKRVKTIDKTASKNKDKDVYLDPIKIRDLNMSVITIATF